jgi:hypothetical protein
MPHINNNHKDIEILCNIIRTNNNISEKFINSFNNTFIETEKQLENKTFPNENNFALFEFYIENHEIIPTINNLICTGDRLDGVLRRLQNSNLFKSLIIKYIYPLILVLGLIGNIISLLTMIQIYRRKQVHKTLTVSLAALSLADLFVLIFGCAREWLEYIFTFEIKIFNNSSCKTILYICYVSSSYSAWIHVFIAMERWIAINKPLKINIICTNKINRVLIISLLILCLIINCPLLWFAELDEKLVFSVESNLGINVAKICEVRHDNFFINGLVLFTDSVFYCVLPFILIFLFSSITIYRLIHSKSMISLNVRRLSVTNNKMRMSGKKITNENASIQSEFGKKTAYCRRIKEENKDTSLMWYFQNSKKFKNRENQSLLSINRKVGSCRSDKSFIRLRNKSNLKSTIMLLSLPICYLFTVLPIIILMLIGWAGRQSDSMKISEDASKDEKFQHFEVAHYVASALMYVNSSINILLYVLFGKNLRGDFLSLLRCTNKIHLVKYSSTVRVKTTRNNIRRLYSQVDVKCDFENQTTILSLENKIEHF